MMGNKHGNWQDKSSAKFLYVFLLKSIDFYKWAWYNTYRDEAIASNEKEDMIHEKD